jgi:hypothetical protein
MKIKYTATILSGSGIGSAIVGIIGSLYYLRSNNIEDKLLVNLYHASKQVKMLFSHFLDLNNIDCIEVVNFKNDYKANYTIGDEYKELYFTEMLNIQNKKLNTNQSIRSDSDFDSFYEIFNNIWKLKDEITNKMILPVDDYKICINVRRGDKITLEKRHKVVEIQEYVNEIKKIYINPVNIFHTSDDYDTLLELKQMIPNYKIDSFREPSDKGYFISDLNTKNDQDNIDYISKFFMELYMMKKSEWFIGVLTTNVGYLAKFLRKNNKVVFIK